VDEGVWKPLPLGFGAHVRGEPWVLEAAEVAELVEFLGVVSGARHGGRIAWALSRFEMGCERALDEEALSDYLLALRALLDADDETARATLSRRVAALCAEQSQRRALQRRVELAFALERFLVGGGSSEAYVESVGAAAPPRQIVREVETHLRAVLRDVLCGYLDPDLKAAADDILVASGEPIEIRATDLRHQPTADSRQPTEPEPAQREMRFTREPEQATGEPAVEVEEAESETGELPAADEDAGVTPSADWELDDDPASYSAPI